MRLQIMKRLCRDTGSARLWNEADGDGNVVRQWITDGRVGVPVTGLPMLEAENLPTLFSLTPVQAEKMTFRSGPLPGLDFGDTRADDRQLVPLRLRLEIEGKRLLPMTSINGLLILLDAERLRAVEAQEMRLFLRETGSVRYVAVMDGLFIAGIVIPEDLTPDMVSEVRQLWKVGET